MCDGQVGKSGKGHTRSATHFEIGCLIFDLDGTLIDSRADLTTSITLMLAEMDQAPLLEERVVSFIGEGVSRLVERALRASQEREPESAEIKFALDIFRRHYGKHLLDHTRVYPEVHETLAHFRHLPKAVVTNKPYDFTLTILEGLGLRSHFAVVLGGDSLPERKPAPQPLLEAARRCGCAPAEGVMIGDSCLDVLAGRAAGMVTCGFVGGFGGRAELVAAGPDMLIDRFGELREAFSDGLTARYQ
ncbi:HAD family hydrolase [soil metagenome]